MRAVSHDVVWSIALKKSSSDMWAGQCTAAWLLLGTPVAQAVITCHRPGSSFLLAGVNTVLERGGTIAITIAVAALTLHAISGWCPVKPNPGRKDGLMPSN